MAKKKSRETRGRKPTENKVTVMSLKRNNQPLKAVRFTLSENLVDRLLALHNKKFPVFTMVPQEFKHIFSKEQLRQQHLKNLRLVFLRLIGDDGLPIPRPHIVIRAETPSYDPRGTRIVRKINGPQSPRARRYQFEVRCKRFGLRAEIPSTSLETEWMDAERGLILYFPLELMEGTETK
jgi:hypothetical protein